MYLRQTCGVDIILAAEAYPPNVKGWPCQEQAMQGLQLRNDDLSLVTLCPHYT